MAEVRMVVERDMKAPRGDHTLLTTLTFWHLLKCAQLTSIMYSMTLIIILDMLMKEDDCWSMMGANKASTSHQRKIIDSGLPNSGDISPAEI
jgi:hypothetical protein